jgi:muramoyltetrapeptide carboxypeptidase
LKPAIDLLHSWGLEVVIGKLLVSTATNLQVLMSSVLLIRTIRQSQYKSIWCVKGGYGTVRIIDLLDFTIQTTSRIVDLVI